MTILGHDLARCVARQGFSHGKRSGRTPKRPCPRPVHAARTRERRASEPTSACRRTTLPGSAAACRIPPPRCARSPSRVETNTNAAMGLGPSRRRRLQCSAKFSRRSATTCRSCVTTRCPLDRLRLGVPPQRTRRAGQMFRRIWMVPRPTRRTAGPRPGRLPGDRRRHRRLHRRHMPAPPASSAPPSQPQPQATWSTLPGLPRPPCTPQAGSTGTGTMPPSEHISRKATCSPRMP